MRSFKSLRGAILISVLVIALVFVLLGISVTGLETSQARYSTWKYNKAVTKQAASAAIRKVEYQLSTQSSWNAGCIDVSERKVEGSNCYYHVEVNDCSKRFCTITAHAYLKENNGNRKWESRIRVTMKKNCFEYAALGACTGGSGDDPGITLTDSSLIDGDVGSFKPANTVAVKIGGTSSATPTATSNNDNVLTTTGNGSNNTVNAFDASTKMGSGVPGKPPTHIMPNIQPLTGTDQPGSEVNPTPQPTPDSTTDPDHPGVTVDPGIGPNQPPGSPEPETSSSPETPEPRLSPTPEPLPIVSCDSSKISGNIFIYKDAVVSGNYQNSQLQIVGNDEVSSTHYTVPEGRDYQDITVQAGTQHSFTSGISTIKNFKAMEGSTIKIDATRGPVLIYIKESFSLNGAKFNVDGDPRNVIIYGAYDSQEKKGCTVSITNSSKASFLFNGKYSQVNVSNSKFSGALISDKVEIMKNSTASFPASLVRMKSMPEILTWEEL
ncbi:MAG: hypothetical protein AB9903_34740 [Vulcanimicrobiota bacterium]